MFNCQLCGITVGPNVRSNVVVLERKIFEHPFRSNANKVKREDGVWEYMPDLGGSGYQIVKEVRTCPHCACYSPELANV